MNRTPEPPGERLLGTSPSPRVGLVESKHGPLGLPFSLPGARWLRVVRSGAYLACAVAVATVAVALLPSQAVAAGSGSNVSLTFFESNVLLQLNMARAEHGLAPLRLNASLTAAASQHCAEMAADGFFAHESAGGAQFWSRIGHYYHSGGFTYWSVGENLLWSSANLGAAHAVAMWMASADHRANLLSPAWRDIGISVVNVADAPGVFDNRRVTVIATDFGLRK